MWTVSDDGIQLVHPNGGVTPVQAQLPGRITAFRLSPGSVRMAVVLEINGQSVLGMVRVNRSATVPVLEEFRPLTLNAAAGGTVRFVDVGWLDASNLIVLAAIGDGPVKPYRVNQSGSESAEIGQPDNWQAVAVASQPDRFGGRASIVGRTGGLALRRGLSLAGARDRHHRSGLSRRLIGTLSTAGSGRSAVHSRVRHPGRVGLGRPYSGHASHHNCANHDSHRF